MHEESEEKKAEVKFEDEEFEIQIKNSPETEGAEGFGDVDGKGGKKWKPWKKLHRKPKKKEIPEVPEVIMLKPRPTIEELQREVEETQDIMRNKVEKLVNEREQRLENVQERAERLAGAAADFAKVSRRVRIKMCLRAYKWRISAAVGVILGLIVIVIVVVLENKGIIKI